MMTEPEAIYQCENGHYKYISFNEFKKTSVKVTIYDGKDWSAKFVLLGCEDAKELAKELNAWVKKCNAS